MSSAKDTRETHNLMEIMTPYLNTRSAGDETVGMHYIEMNNDAVMHDACSTAPSQPRQANSTSTIFVKSTIAHPNETEVMQSVASVLHCIMLQHTAIPTGGAAPSVVPELGMFDERTYTGKESRKRLRWGFYSTNKQENSHSQREFPDEGVPPVSEIFMFLIACSRRASFSSECSIIALVLLNRLLTTPGRISIQLHAFNWRLFFLTSLMVAQKIWDDKSLANIDFPVIWRHAVQVKDDNLDVKAFNNMEVKFLELLQFNVYVSARLYAQFCFELRSIHNANSNTDFPLAPLTLDQATKLEANSSLDPTVLRAHVKSVSKSVGAEAVGKKGQYILS